MQTMFSCHVETTVPFIRVKEGIMRCYVMSMVSHVSWTRAWSLLKTNAKEFSLKGGMATSVE